mmetsp:Transcript_20795/g.41608  ORF Transcript_20795/g.41608 Transcript_20795/m.41608 type:complete len:197 (-) Transcript_20795:207-797(-)
MLSRAIIALYISLITSRGLAPVSSFGEGLVLKRIRRSLDVPPLSSSPAEPAVPLPSSSESQLSPKSSRASSVLRGGTEPAFSSELDGEDRAGTFVCAGCLAPLFFSECKFDSGTGWPSFWAASADAVVVEGGGPFANPLAALFGRDVGCNSCGGHLGHRFDDGPRRTTGKRFCINGAALRFRNDGPAPKGTPLMDS